MSIGQRIAFWAESFSGVPYDTDPLGKYVREERIVVDDAVDCMYHTFRSVELAMSKTPREAEDKALRLRFHGRGLVHAGKVLNYDDRFQYGEDMIDSGKWGKEITLETGRTERITGSRGREYVDLIPKEEMMRISNIKEGGPLREGDVVFFIKYPEKRGVGEIVGHLGIISMKGGVPYLIHAGGRKAGQNSNGGGSVKVLKLSEYVRDMVFAGVRITRFE